MMYNLLHLVFDILVGGWFPSWWTPMVWGSFALRAFWSVLGWRILGLAVPAFGLACWLVAFSLSSVWQSLRRIVGAPLWVAGPLDVTGALIGALGGSRRWWAAAVAVGLVPRVVLLCLSLFGLPLGVAGVVSGLAGLSTVVVLFSLLFSVRVLLPLARVATSFLLFLTWRAVKGFRVFLWVLFGLVFPADGRASYRRLFPLSLFFGEVGSAAAAPLRDQVDGSGQPVDSAFGRGVDEFAHLRLGAVYCARPRRRALWVRRLECVLGGPRGCVGDFVRGRWTPDLTSPGVSVGANVVLSHMRDGVKIQGGGSVRTSAGADGVVTREAYIIVELRDGSREVVFPELLSKLASYCILRERSAVLVSALRLRALEWCKARGLTASDSWCALPGALRFAWEVSPAERRLREGLSGGPSPPLWWSSA